MKVANNRDRRHPVQRAAFAGTLLEPEGAVLGHEDVPDFVVVARGAAKPGRLPRVDHPRLGSGDEELAHERLPVCAHERRAVVHEHGARDVPDCVARAARQLPAAADAVAAVEALRDALIRPEVSRRDRRRVTEDLVRALRRKHPAEDAVAAADHRAPAGGAVGVRHLLDDTQEGERLGLGAADGARDQQAKDAGVAECLDHGGWDRPRAIHHRALLADHLRQRADGRDGIRSRSWGVALRAHGCSLVVVVRNLARRWPASMSELPYVSVEVQRSRWRTA
jgi:hypothetical protein